MYGEEDETSLPTRERELKPSHAAVAVLRVESLPTRERELKHVQDAEDYTVGKSLPTRERELKPTSSERS